MKGLQRKIFQVVLATLLTGCLTLDPELQKKASAPAKIPSSLSPESPASPKKIAVALLQADMDWFKKKLIAVHPAPFYRFASSEFEREFRSIKKSIREPLTKREFYLRLAPLLARLGDTHSYLKYPSLSKETAKQSIFPLAVVLENERLWVATDLATQPQVPSGAEILMINNKPISDILQAMRLLISRETQAGQARKIQVDFSWLLVALGYSSSSFQLSYRWQQQEFYTSVAALPISHQNKSDPNSYYGFSRLTADTWLFWLNDFNEEPEVFERYLEKKFRLMAAQGGKNLIIDVRFNQGGLSHNLKQLLAHLTQKPIYWATNGSIKISKPLKKNHFDNTKARREEKYSWGLQWLPWEWTDKLQHKIWWADPGDTLSLRLEPVEPIEKQNPKRVWVLTNGYCYSACSLFVASVNYYQLAKTLGESVGSLAARQFVYPLELTLPTSRLNLVLPTMQIESSESEDPELLQPQYKILRTQDDIRLRRDPVLDKALLQAGSAIEID